MAGYIGNRPSKANIGVFTPNQQFNLARRGVWNPPVPVPVLSFDGTDDYVTVADAPEFSPSVITIEAYIFPTADTDGNVVSKNFNSGYRLRRDLDGTISFFDGGSTNKITSSTVVALNQWTHVACIGNASGLGIYLNGQLDASNSTAYGAPDTTGNLLIGMGELSSLEPFQGDLSDIRIWSTARTQTEIQDNINYRLIGNETGLVAYYKLDEGTGTTATDSAGSNDGTINGATWVQESDLELYE